MEAQNRLWVIATGAVAVLLLVAGWFIAIGPQIDRIADNTSQRISVELQNDAHEASLAALKAEFENIDQLKADLAELRRVIPAGDDLSTFIGELHQLESATGVTINGITTSGAVRYEPAPPLPSELAAQEAAKAAAAEAAAEADSATSEDSSTSDEAVAPSGPLTAGNFIVLPLDIEIVGTHEQVMAFTDALQTGTRLFLVTALTLTQDSDGKPVYNGNISGYTYVLFGYDSPELGGPVAP